MEIRAIREWAIGEGIEVGVRGRLSLEVIYKYLLAHPREAKDLARAYDIDVPRRGRMSNESRMLVAVSLR